MKTAVLYVSCLIMLAIVSPIHALYSKSDNVKLLTPTTWKTEVTNSKHVVLAEFFAPWCGHCKNLVPTYETVADKTKGVVKVVAVDCDAHQSFCGQFDVKGFPTIKLFQSDKSKKPLEYQGARDAAPMVSFAVSKVISFVEKIKDVDGLAKFTDNKKIPKVILFSKKTATPSLFKALSVEYENRIAFGEVSASNTKLCDKFNVESFPSVVLVKADSNAEDFIPYKDVMKHAGLIKFFDTYAEKKKETTSEPKKEKKKEREPLDPKIPEINSQKTYSTHCLSQSKTCLISILSRDASEDLKTLEILKKSLYDSKDDDKFAISITYDQKFIRKFHGASDALPGLIAVNHARGWYRWFMGGFDKDGLLGLVADLKKGKGRNFKIDKEMLEVDEAATKKADLHDEL